jgi:CRISPR-associated protein Csx14
MKNSGINQEITLVATLGGQPQIVTFTLDLLFQQGYEVTQVLIVYLSGNKRYRQSYQRLAGEFVGDRYHGTPCHLRNIPVRLQGHLIEDARTPGEVDVVWKTFYHLFAELKDQGQCIHLSLTGGRRMMALLAFSVAMLHFDSADRAWHLHTPEDVTAEAYNGALLHVPPDAGIHLIEVPLVPWGTYFPGVRSLLGRSPQEVRSTHLGWLDEHERARCSQVWEQLSPRQRDALRALVATPDRAQAADRLGVAVTTLDSHKSAILRTCRLTWENDDLDIHFLRRKFAPFLAGLGEV